MLDRLKSILFPFALLLGPTIIVFSFALRSVWLGLSGLAITLPALLFGFRGMYDGELQYRRDQKGLCIHCGYDLRASGSRCPECGRPTNSSPDFD